ncbi:hypothetical protein EDB81DRAFT_889955 [Dactylonectria macrodidyma]|uniref:Uncharacterized protein n=1 Tax=Dactylonectria macrodidyma TaxID=307937 RepID=A0A9P9DRT0_9HYPO|nr:hypothetical protein EDB81DRAFT_889955 [Dactylonectria macrodidyma]
MKDFFKCLDNCNNVSTIAEAEGKTSELCEPGSTFRMAIEICNKCIVEATGHQFVNGATVDVLNLIDEYLDFCHIGVTTSMDTYTMSDGRLGTVAYIMPVAEATTVSLSATALESPSLSTRSGLSNSSVTPVDSRSISPDSSSTKSSGNKSWIAGPILGSIIGVALILGTVVYIWRRRSRVTRPDGLEPPYGKAQLHSDCIPKSARETEAQVIHEMEGPSAQPVEKAANEVPAAELAAAGEM